MYQNIKSKFHINILGTLVVLIIIETVLIIIFLFVERNDIYALLKQNKLVPLPASYTELYFSNNNYLPSTLQTNSPVKFSFVIHNVENKDYTYTYAVYNIDNSKKILFDQKTITLKNNQQITINELYLPKDLTNNQEIMVNIVNLNQSIDFWL